MHTVIRRFEGIDSSRLEEMIGSIKDEFIGLLEDIEGLISYQVIDAGNDVICTIGTFETAEAAEESTRLSGTFIREHGFADAIPNPPQVTMGEVVAQRAGVKTT
jgi:hypothetical protein